MLNAYVHIYLEGPVLIHSDCDNNDDNDNGDYSKMTISRMITKYNREIWNFKYMNRNFFLLE